MALEGVVPLAGIDGAFVDTADQFAERAEFALVFGKRSQIDSRRYVLHGAWHIPGRGSLVPRRGK